MPTVTTAAPWHAAYRAARDRAALFDLADSGLIELTGPERQAYVHSLCTNKVVDLEPGRGVRALLLNPTKGRTLADFLACETGDALWLECRGGSATTVLEVLGKYFFGQAVEVVDRTAAWEVAALQGPGAAELLAALGSTLPDEVPAAHVATAIGPVSGRVVRWNDTGGPGFHLWLPRDGAEAARAALAEAGAVRGGAEAWTVLQIEAGVAAFGRDLTPETIPLEAPTEDAINHVKGCYPGQEVIARLHVRGRPAKHLRGLRVEGEARLAPGMVLDAAGKPGAATVTASGVSPELGSIALAYVHRDHCSAGTRLTGEGRAAVVADLPLR